MEAAAKMRLAIVVLLIAGACSIPIDQHSKARHVATKVSHSLANQFGWKKDEFSMWEIKANDVRYGESLLYEFEVDVGGNVVPLKLSEDISKWRKQENEAPVSIPSFQLAGPIEVWIQDPEQLRLSLPHDVDAGVLNRVLLADGANVTVTGAREISLERPLKLPFSKDETTGSSLMPLSGKLRYASRASEKPLLSLRIVGPTSMAAHETSSSQNGDFSSSMNRLKVKRLSPNAVQLVHKKSEANQLVEDDRVESEWLWPLPSINGSNAKLRAVEEALEMFFDSQVGDKRSFNLLRAKASAARLAKVEFVLEKRVDPKLLELWPEWAAKPTVDRFRFELITKLEGDKLDHQVVSLRALDSVVFPQAMSQGGSNITTTRAIMPLMYWSPLLL